MIKAIIFDMGGVILDFSKNETLRIPKALSIIFDVPVEQTEKIWDSPLRERILTGKITPIEFLKEAKKKLNSNKEISTLLNKWILLSTKGGDCINWDLLDYIKELKAKYKVYVLSDAVDVAQDDEITKDIRAMFDSYYTSYEEGYKKPDKAAFINVMKKIDLKPEECLFVDDTIENITAAAELGIQTIRYQDFDQFKKALSKI